MTQILCMMLLAASLPLKALASQEAISLDELRERFEVQAQIFVFDADGKKLLRPPRQTNSWSKRKGVIENQWSSNSTGVGEFAIRHRWEIKDNGVIHVSFEEFGEVVEKGGDTEFRKSLKKDERDLNGFESVSWRVQNIRDKAVVLRFLPVIREVPEAEDLGAFPLAGKGMVLTDSSGQVWATGLESSEKYVGFSTHRGTIVLSYAPFKGATQAGFASGNKLELKLPGGEQKLSLVSQTPFLPAGVDGKIYALYEPGRKTNAMNSVHTFESTREERILQRLHSSQH